MIDVIKKYNKALLTIGVFTAVSLVAFGWFVPGLFAQNTTATVVEVVDGVSHIEREAQDVQTAADRASAAAERAAAALTVADAQIALEEARAEALNASTSLANAQALLNATSGKAEELLRNSLEKTLTALEPALTPEPEQEPAPAPAPEPEPTPTPAPAPTPRQPETRILRFGEGGTCLGIEITRGREAGGFTCIGFRLGPKEPVPTYDEVRRRQQEAANRGR